MSSPLIVTAKIDDASFEFFDEMRRQFFPPERNFLSAHITLFHHLPGEELLNIKRDLKETVSEHSVFEIEFSGVRFLGRGSAIEIESKRLVSIRTKLADEWQNWLTRQDQQKFKPHITVQNKVEPGEAKILFEKLKSEWQPKKASVVGLQLWYYRGGPWELNDEFNFRDDV